MLVRRRCVYETQRRVQINSWRYQDVFAIWRWTIVACKRARFDTRSREQCLRIAC